jgi:predicted RNA polymerase sigma factor
VKPPPIREASPLARPKALDQLGASEDATRSAIPPDNPQTTGVALTLRAVGGLTTAEIANAFLVPEATMAQRISRGKETIRSSGVALRMPTREERARRLNAVLHTLYVICSEGYTSSAGPTLHRTDLSSEAMRLARALQQVLRDDAEVAALLAVMLLTDARLPARTDANGERVLLDEQDRTLWNKEFIAEGVALVSAAPPKGPVGP